MRHVSSVFSFVHLDSENIGLYHVNRESLHERVAEYDSSEAFEVNSRRLDGNSFISNYNILGLMTVRTLITSNILGCLVAVIE